LKSCRPTFLTSPKNLKKERIIVAKVV